MEFRRRESLQQLGRGGRDLLARQRWLYAWNSHPRGSTSYGLLGKFVCLFFYLYRRNRVLGGSRYASCNGVFRYTITVKPLYDFAKFVHRNERKATSVQQCKWEWPSVTRISMIDAVYLIDEPYWNCDSTDVVRRATVRWLRFQPANTCVRLVQRVYKCITWPLRS